MFVGAVFFPLLGACISGFLGRWIGDRAAQWSAVVCMALAAACGLAAFWEVALQGRPESVVLFRFLDVGDLEVAWALRYDTLSAVMVGMVTVISALIHLYSVGYMAHDETPGRFFAYLSLFTFMMLMLVTADNLVQLFFGWEGVGLASYLLIGYWYERESANAAAMKAFIVNRVGDLFFMLGMALTFYTFESLEFAQIFAAAASHAQTSFMGVPALELIGLLLFLGACGKSAQLGLHTWLPDAMEGPTPVSALIHAATMVTAGVFLMARMSPLMEHAPVALSVVVVVGASTAFFAATVGCVQNDIKRIIAYSTCSQLGYMFVAAGLGLYQAAIFHLFTHAFFKALLFLGAGSVIHAMSDEQDIRRMGGLWRKIPLTYAVMWVGSLALAGVPIFAGYYSKDAILEGAVAAHSTVGLFAFVCLATAAFLTAFYSWRLLFLTFHGTPRAAPEVMAHVHESPAVMLLPLVVLAAGATVTGFLFMPYFLGDLQQGFWNGALFNLPEKGMMEALHHAPAWVPTLAKALAAGGIALAFVMYVALPSLPARLAAAMPGLYRFLLHKWYFDELYDRLFVRPLRRLAVLFWQVGDVRLIDGLPNGAAAIAAGMGRGAARLQSGRVASYAFAMIVGLTLFLTLLLLGR
ncbi:MAG: NADH-quinone oxidoreductase subunit L [Rhodovarius sp.]|nr:NADH-quinone oxidoreductase subunit L [Rhodovarius sp.]